MAGFQNFTPVTANLAEVWKGFNPAANFLGGAKAVQQMDLDEAAEERLRELADTDRMVKETLLPYEVRLANAKIGATQAQAGYYAARAERDTEDATAAALFENFQGKSYGEMKGLLKPQTSGGEAAPATPQRNFSLEGVNSNIGEAPSGPLSSFAEEPDDLFGSLGVTREELTNPKYALASAPQGASTDVPPNNEAMQVLEKRKADQPSSPTSLLSEQQSEDLKGIRSNLYKDSNPLLNMPEIQAREAKKKEDSLGSFITNEYSFLQEQENLTALLSKKNPERVARGAAVEYMKSQFNSEAAKKFGISPAAVPMLVYSSRGVLRSSEEIDQIHGAMKQGYVDLPDDKGQMLRYEVKSPEDAVALTEKQRMTPINRAATGGDPLKQQQDFLNIFKSWTEARTNAAENPDDRDAQILYKVATNRFKQLAGEDYEVAAFNLGQQEATDLIKYGDQPVRPDGKPTQGLEDQTASQVLAEKINSGGFIPVVKGAYNNGELGFDDAELAKQFPGGKLVEGGIFAVNDEKQSNLYKVKDGRPIALFSKPAPESEGGAGATTSKGFSEKNPFAKQAEQEIRAKEIGSRKTDLDSAKTQLQAVEREIELLSNPPQESAASQRLGLPNYPASNISKAKKFEELNSKKKQLEKIIQTKRGFRRG